MSPSSIRAALDSLCIEVTTRCPLRCVHCSTCSSPERTGMADADALCAYLSELPGLREIYLSGGEPFEHMGLLRIAEMAVTRADRVVIYSSGTTIGPKGIAPLGEDVLRQLVSAGVDRVDLSIYGGQPSTHEAITATSGSLGVTLESARRIRQVGLELGIHFVPLPANELDLPNVALLAMELGAERLHVLAPARQGRAARTAPTRLSDRVLSDIRALQRWETPYALVLSSAVRAALGDLQKMERDAWQTGMLDVQGYLYPGEGLKIPSLRSPQAAVEYHKLPIPAVW